MKHFLSLMCLVAVIGCAEQPATEVTPTETAKTEVKDLPVFVNEWSEYPSWSALDVASLMSIVNGEEGAPYSPLELEYGVDIVLKRRDYVQSLKEYASSMTDSVCVTNIDALNLAKGRPSTAILPTSTSDGADGVIVDPKKIEDLKHLKKHVTKGAEQSVSQYMFYACLENLKEDPKKFKFENMDPDVAANAFQSGKEVAVAVWQPFLERTLHARDDSKLLFDSSTLKREIVDMVLVGNDALQREGGENFAKAICDMYYQLNAKMAQGGPDRDAVVVNIGKKFSNLGLEEMEEVLKTCKFFKTPDEAEGVFGDNSWHTLMKTTIVERSINVGIVTKEELPTIGFNDPDKDLNFSTKYLRKKL